MKNPKLIDYDFVHEGGEDTFQFSDITLRDLFAGIAMHGMICALETKSIGHMADGTLGGARVSSAAYTYADAMLAERAKRERE